jgi:hypothetical protein
MTYVTVWYCTKNSTKKHIQGTSEILLGLRSKLKFMKLCRELIYNIDYNFPRTFTEKQLLQSWEGNYSLQKLLNTLETYLRHLIKQQMPKSQFAVQKFQPDLLAHSDDQNKCKFSVKKTQRGHKTLEISEKRGMIDILQLSFGFQVMYTTREPLLEILNIPALPFVWWG